MSLKQRRYALKSKEIKQILNDASQRLKMDLESIFGSKAIIEVVEFENGQICIVNAKPVMFRAETFLPFLGFTEFIEAATKITVDMGAVPFVCKGANVMAPGIRCIEGEFSKGDLLVIKDEKHGKSLAIGESMFDAATVRETKKGPVIKTLHYVSDKYWNAAKLLTE
ncbi:MAG: RNA-binding protein [Nitrososphaerota archaeon]|jgi:PUA domain protein|uniref:PUA domain-containing protein n=1 Tax=Candidatus Bathycorpusculum sp. TaxID=2994959 RepID=UPI002834067B|nr:RNA-binding protein [Candidatus Termiticorpusculum sp.]MCL2257180.1 RNA-binding protein [Candidatus Termiticorpusculum sp.]MCL2292683.1 RNA-binding protein [Candidatus Termiticorpusculum sp.]MDR0461542.1 RNA-binding protein [Nitrososphaerota archaeon]